MDIDQGKLEQLDRQLRLIVSDAKTMRDLLKKYRRRSLTRLEAHFVPLYLSRFKDTYTKVIDGVVYFQSVLKQRP